MVTGSARNVRLTNPPSVAAPHAAKNRTKNAMPSAILDVRETGTSGVSIGACPVARRARPALVLLDEARVDGRGHVRHALDDAQLQQQVRSLLAEGLDLAVEEPTVGLAVLPAEVGLRLLELLARLLHHSSHDLEALLG